MQTGLFNAALMYGIVKSYSSRSYLQKTYFTNFKITVILIAQRR